MLRIRRVYRLGRPLNRSSILPAERWVNPLSKQTLRRALHLMAPTFTALLFAGIGSGVAHAQGTMDFSGAQTLMGTFNRRFAYVYVSRASHDAQVFTNDAAQLAESLSKDVSKSSALDFGKTQTQVSKVGTEQSQLVKSAPGRGLGLAL